MNDFFSNVVSSLNIPQYENLTVDIDQFEDPGLIKNKNHPSIRAIKENSKDNQFTFESISKSDIKKEILNLDSTKAIHNLICVQKSLNKMPMNSQNPCFLNLGDL